MLLLNMAYTPAAAEERPQGGKETQPQDPQEPQEVCCHLLYYALYVYVLSLSLSLHAPNSVLTVSRLTQGAPSHPEERLVQEADTPSAEPRQTPATAPTGNRYRHR